MSSELGVVARTIAFVAERLPVEKMSFRHLVTRKDVHFL